MAVTMLGVRIEPSSFRWFNSVYHRWADRGQGAGTRTWGLAGSKTQLRGGQASREPVCWAAQVASQWSRATRATLGLMASSKARSSRRRRKGMEGGRSGEKGEMWARAAEARVPWSRVEARAPQAMRQALEARRLRHAERTVLPAVAQRKKDGGWVGPKRAGAVAARGVRCAVVSAGGEGCGARVAWGGVSGAACRGCRVWELDCLRSRVGLRGRWRVVVVGVSCYRCPTTRK